MSSVSELKELREILLLATQFLEKAGVAAPRREAEFLLARWASLSRTELYMNLDRPCTEGELVSLRALLKRRAKREPLSYIFGETEFFGAFFEVGPAALIPRNETEILVAKVADIIKKEVATPLVVLDLCCGSGCIGMSLKKHFPAIELYASDLSVEALALARRNSVKNGLSVEFLQGDLLAPFLPRKADLILCNPPYISESEFKDLEPEVRLFEPKMALVSGATGLEFYEKLERTLPEALKPHGKVVFEIGGLQADALFALFAAPIWVNKRVEKDFGGHDRFFFLEIE